MISLIALNGLARAIKTLKLRVFFFLESKQKNKKRETLVIIKATMCEDGKEAENCSITKNKWMLLIILEVKHKKSK